VPGSVVATPAPSSPITPKKPSGEPISVGNIPTASVPPINVAMVRSAQSNVVVYTEESYAAHKGEDYESISKTKYQNAKYAKALLQFNQSHPLADDNVPEDGVLKGPQTVYIPPKEVLEKRYPDLIKSSSLPPSH